jgi:hypothetical protein
MLLDNSWAIQATQCRNWKFAIHRVYRVMYFSANLVLMRSAYIPHERGGQDSKENSENHVNSCVSCVYRAIYSVFQILLRILTTSLMRNISRTHEHKIRRKVHHSIYTVYCIFPVSALSCPDCPRVIP